MMGHLGSGCPYPWDQCKCDRPGADQVVRNADGSIIPEPTPISNRVSRSAIAQVLHEFDFGDGVVNASDADVERMAAEIARLRTEAEQTEMDAMRRKYLHYGHGPQEGGSDDEA